MMKSIKKRVRLNYSLAFYLAKNRLLPTSDSPGLVLLPRLAFFSIVIGVTASVLILSLSNGLHHNYLKKIAEADSHITVVSAGRGIPNYLDVMQKIKANKDVVDAYPYSQNEALLKSYGETSGVILKSYMADFTEDPVFNQYFRLLSGEWSFNTPRSITVGEALAKNMALFVGDYVDIMIYDKDFGAVSYRFKISGIFSAGDGVLDKGLVFIGFNDAAEIFDFEGYAPSIGIRIKDYQNVEKTTRELEKTTDFRLKTWKLAHLNTLLAFENEKQIIKVLLLIFFCVAFFGILAVMTALVSDKRDEIALLKTLGMSSSENFYSFLFTGLLLGTCAALIGVVTGVILSWRFNNITGLIESLINMFINLINITMNKEIGSFYFLNQNVYYLKEFPIKIQLTDIVFSVISAILCTVLAAVYPAYLSKKFNAADILRKRAF